MRLAIVGAGFVGLTTAVVLAEHGHDVTIVEANEERVSELQEGRVPFHEPGLQEALAACISLNKVRVTSDVALGLDGAAASFLCVGTPQGVDGMIDLSYIRQAAEEIGSALRNKHEDHIVVVKSTVVPGTAAKLVAPAVEATSGRRIPVASNPEFLKEGCALHDARYPDRIVVGADHETAAWLWQIYSGFDCPKLTFSKDTAEMIKYVANSFLAVKIAFANEMANVCSTVGVDWQNVVDGIGYDERINPRFFQAGVGFGGSCFPKDVAALSAFASQNNAPSGILSAALANNEAQPRRVVSILEGIFGSIQGKRIALLGLAFKADTDDVRETRALPILRALEHLGATVTCHDPVAGPTFQAVAPNAKVAGTVLGAIDGADAIILQTAWQEYAELKASDVAAAMPGRVVVDGRRALNVKEWQDAGFDYRAIGLGKN